MYAKYINDKINRYPILDEVMTALVLKNVSQRTVVNYMDGIVRFLDFIEYDNSFDITEEHFRSYLFHLHSTDLSKITINTYNSFIRFFFNSVLQKTINPYRVPKSKITPKDIDFLFDHQITSLLAAVGNDTKTDCIIKLALCCGLRVDEIASLKVSDISTRDINNMTIYVRESKRNKSRYVPIDKTMYHSLQRYAKEYHIAPGSDSNLIFYRNKDKTPTDSIRYHFNHYRNIAKIPSSYTFHCLRHTYAVNFLRAGGDLLDLKYRLGHSSFASTSRYLHFARNMMNTNISYMDTFMKGGAYHAD